MLLVRNKSKCLTTFLSPRTSKTPSEFKLFPQSRNLPPCNTHTLSLSCTNTHTRSSSRVSLYPGIFNSLTVYYTARSRCELFLSNIKYFTNKVCTMANINIICAYAIHNCCRFDFTVENVKTTNKTHIHARQSKTFKKINRFLARLERLQVVKGIGTISRKCRASLKL